MTIHNVLAAMAALLASVLIAPRAMAEARNVVLVHGGVLDGSSWRVVHDILIKEGYNVNIVQNPLTGLHDDVAATSRILDLQEGSVVLVGHSYGGAVITVAGADPDVKALVYVAALQPDTGESVADLNASFPPATDHPSVRVIGDGLITVDPALFRADIAADVPEAGATFVANSQVPTSPDVFSDMATVAAWHDKPSYAVVATHDRSVNPDLQRWMYQRSGAVVTELETSHVPQMSQPDAVATVIMEAARAVE